MRFVRCPLYGVVTKATRERDCVCEKHRGILLLSQTIKMAKVGF